MAGRKLSRKWRKWIITIVSVIAGILILLLIANWWLNKKWQPLIRDQITQRVLDASDGLYHIEYQHLSFNLLIGNVTVTGVKLIPDTARYRQLEAGNHEPDDLFHLQLNKITIKHFHPWQLLFSKRLVIKTLLINEPRLQVLHSSDSLQQHTKKNPYNLISGKLSSVKVGTIQLNDLQFNYHDKQDSMRDVKVGHLYAYLSDLQLDSTSMRDSTRYFYAKECRLELKGYSMSTPDSLYRLSVGNLQYSFMMQQLSLKNLQLKPRLGKAAFNRKVKVQKDRFDINVSDIAIEGIGINEIMNKKVDASSAKLANATINIYMSRALPKPDKEKLYPQQMLRQAKLPIAIDTVKTSNIDINYTEYNPKTQREGTVSFQKISGDLYNITNDSMRWQKNNHLKADLNAYFMGTGPLTTHFDFILDDPNSAFSFRGQLGAMNGKDINEVAEPLGGVKIKSCKIHKLDFNFSANRQSSHGKIKFLYDKLKVGILKTPKDDPGEKNHLFKSLIFNVLMLRNSNPSVNGDVRVSDVDYQRKPETSVFNIMWKSIFTGVKDCVSTPSLKNYQQKHGGGL